MDKHRTLLNKAIQAGRNRDYEEAARLLTRIVTDTDDYPEAYLYLGRSYHALGDYNKAILYLTFYRKQRPGSSAGDFYLARAYLKTGIPAKALPLLEHAAASTSSVKPIILLGLAHMRCRNFSAAVEYLGTAVERAPENRRIYIGYLNALLIHALRRFHAGDLDMARQTLEFLAELKLESVTVYLYLAKTLREIGEYAEAARFYQKASGLEPEDELIRLQLADTLYSAGDAVSAAAIVREISHSLPDGENFSLGRENVEPLLAVRNFQNSDFHKAIYHGCQSLKFKRDADMHLLVGESYRNTGNFKRAENHFKQVLKGNPGSSEAKLGLAMLDWQQEEYESMLRRLEGLLGTREYGDIARYYSVLCRCRLDFPPEEMLDLVREEIRRSGPDPFILCTLADQYVRADLSDLAVKWYRKTLQLNDEHTPAREGLIECFSRTGDDKALIELYREILERDEESVPVRIQLIERLYKTERYKEAADEAENLLSLRDLDQRLQRLLAICYRKTRRYRDAAVIYRELLKEEPESEVYLRSLLYCLDKSRRRKQAIELLKNAIDYLKSPSSSLHLILGVLLHKDGDIEAAMASFRSAMEKAPKDWRAYYNIGKIYRVKGLDTFADKFSKKAEELKISEKQA
jgi:tetratricopeptide (TPR) repeat protein